MQYRIQYKFQKINLVVFHNTKYFTIPIVPEYTIIYIDIEFSEKRFVYARKIRFI